MPVRSTGYATARVLTVAALALAVVVAAVVLFRAGGEYRVKIQLENASQLVKGNLVKVGGNEVGVIERIRLTRDSQAEVIVRIEDDDLAPLHDGTIATVRATSLSGVANRYVALAPGPNDTPEIANGGAIRAEDTRSTVDLDQIFNTLDMETRNALATVVRQSRESYVGAEAEANAGLHVLNPALSQTAATMREVARDSPALSRFVVEGAAVANAVASRDTDLEQGIANAAAVASAVAGERAALDETLAAAPGVLRRANSTFVNVRAALEELEPALREARPVAPRLATTLRVLAPTLARARPVVADLRGALPELATVLRRLPGLERSMRPAVVSAARALNGARPIVTGLRPYVPDVVAGLLNGFGGTTGGYYDANGHYARISFQGGPFSLNSTGNLIPVPPSDGTLSKYEKGIVARCPGAATQPHPDRSNPFTPPGIPCNPAESP